MFVWFVNVPHSFIELTPAWATDRLAVLGTGWLQRWSGLPSRPFPIPRTAVWQLGLSTSVLLLCYTHCYHCLQLSANRFAYSCTFSQAAVVGGAPTHSQNGGRNVRPGFSSLQLHAGADVEHPCPTTAGDASGDPALPGRSEASAAPQVRHQSHDRRRYRPADGRRHPLPVLHIPAPVPQRLQGNGSWHRDAPVRKDDCGRRKLHPFRRSLGERVRR